ncbi:MAG: hypothetical protein JW771_00280 [Candidatus Thermoplasmatota archaeon]|nr:hypothetical protein [Candidatus Thermoplasmatota archaeon]
MSETHSLAELRKKAHEINCELSEGGYDPREIEVIGYYLKRIAASYLSFFTHKELSKSAEGNGEFHPQEAAERADFS